MHIPDGYLSPQTCAVLGAGMLPAWYIASRKVEKKLPSRHVPLLAVSAAFAFVVQMFNVPVPGGTTAHIVGGTLVAIVLGPWAAVLAMSIALVIQSLFFGDGGITAIGANAFNMALIGPFTGYALYRLISSGSDISSSRRVVAAGIGAFVGANASALLTGVELGLQPLLFKSASGAPLYSPYGLAQAVPALMAAHLLVVGPLEAIVTGLVVAYLQRANVGLLAQVQRTGPKVSPAGHGSRRWVWITVALFVALIIALPLGSLATGTAWGEWGAEDLGSTLGFVPEGLRSMSGVWSGLLTNYNVPGWDDEWLSRAGYIISGLIGIGVVAAITLLFGRTLSGRGKRHEHS